MTIKGNLTTKDVIQKFEKMDERYAKLVGDINLALGKLSATTEELKKSREIYEKPLYGCFKKAVEKHPKLSICSLVLILSLTIFGIFDFLKGKKVNLNKEGGRNFNLQK